MLSSYFLSIIAVCFIAIDNGRSRATNFFLDFFFFLAGVHILGLGIMGMWCVKLESFQMELIALNGSLGCSSFEPPSFLEWLSGPLSIHSPFLHWLSFWWCWLGFFLGGGWLCCHYQFPFLFSYVQVESYNRCVRRSQPRR